MYGGFQVFRAGVQYYCPLPIVLRAEISTHPVTMLHETCSNLQRLDIGLVFVSRSWQEMWIAQNKKGDRKRMRINENEIKLSVGLWAL